MAERLPPELLANCDTNHGPMLLVLGWLFLSIAIITVLLRLYFRHFHRNGLHLDDMVMLASLIAGIIAVSWLTVLINAGLGQHIYCLPPDQVPTAVHASILGQIFNILGIGLVKVSVCLTVLRIIDRGVSPALKLFIWTLLVFACLSHSAQILLFIIQCRPMRAIWDVSLVAEGKARCFSSHITYLAGYIGFGLDAFTDLACAAIPILIVNRLRLSPRTKTALCVLMGLGSLTAACAVAKAVTLRGVFADDYTYALTKPAVCTILEHLFGIILASLPALRPLVAQLLDGMSAKRLSSPYSNGRHNNDNGAGAGAAQQRRPPPAMVALSPRSYSHSHTKNNNNNNYHPSFLPPTPQAPALAVSSPRSPRFPTGGGGGGGAKASKSRRRSRTSWWAMPDTTTWDRKSWRRKSSQHAPPPAHPPPPSLAFVPHHHDDGEMGAPPRRAEGGGGIPSHWPHHHHHHHHHHHRQKKSDDNDNNGMVGGSSSSSSQDTTVVGSATTTPGLKDQFSALEKGGMMVVVDLPPGGARRAASSSSSDDENENKENAAAQPPPPPPHHHHQPGAITRTVSFRVSSEHYESESESDGHGGPAAAHNDQSGGGGSQPHQHQHRQRHDEEWPLNPLSPVDGVSPWYEDEEAGGGGSPHEDYLRVRGWHRGF